MSLVVIAHNIRSTYNVGAILRSCDGFGVDAFCATGYTPYPTINGDTRLPHERDKLTRQIAKTALGAEHTVPISHVASPAEIIKDLKNKGYAIAALEQSPGSIQLSDYRPPAKLALLLGEEVHGITPELLKLCNVTLEIPMKGSKESFNVSVATGIALYALTIARHNAAVLDLFPNPPPAKTPVFPAAKSSKLVDDPTGSPPPFSAFSLENTSVLRMKVGWGRGLLISLVLIVVQATGGFIR
jgi:tRNA(Leu) C34 or U34 (ribose-2'-O)-methylase TrmL